MINKAKKIIRELRPHTTNIFWSNVNQVVVTVSALVVSIILTRLGDEEGVLYGQYLFVLGVFGLLSIVSIPGVQVVVFRATAQGYDGVYRKATIFSVLWSMAGIGLLVITGVFFYLFKTKILGLSLIVSAFFFPFMTSLRNWILFLKGRSEFGRLAFYNLVKLLASIIAVWLSIVFTGNLIVVLGAYFLVNSGFNILYHQKSLDTLTNNELDEGWKRQSYALTVLSLSTIIFGKVDIVLLGLLFEKTGQMGQVAVYGLIMKFVDVFFSTIKSTMEGVVPSLYKSKTITIRYFYKFFLLSFLVPFVLWWVVKYPILFIYPKRYSEVIFYSQVYLIVIPFYFLNLTATHFLIKYKLDKELNIGRIISIIAVMVFYSVLIPLFGIWGGVISSMLYFIVQLVVNLLLLKIRKPKNKRRLEGAAMISKESDFE
ncbi:MAG: lipopolysaccharide biosynthesis protein [Planctomycetota bacterium]